MKTKDILFGSHLVPLTRAFDATQGDVLELGTGAFSTPHLHLLCEMYRRKLVSYDDDAFWWDKVLPFEEDFHECHFVRNHRWSKIPIEEQEWGLAFIDNRPTKRRQDLARRLASKAKIIVMHDSQPGRDKTFHYSEIYPLFTYRFDYDKLLPNTVILSNFIDVSQWKA